MLVVGGTQDSTNGLSSAEIYDPATGVWSPTGSLHTGRNTHVATLLPNGTVLVAGGAGAHRVPLASAEIYDPATGSWTETGSLANARWLTSGVSLSDGRFLVVGGQGNVSTVAEAEIYDPSTGLWSSANEVRPKRLRTELVLLPGARVLSVGGADSLGGAVGASSVYNERRNLWQDAPPLNFDRVEGHTATLLPSGDVLVAGGEANLGPTTATCELFSIRPPR